MARVGIGPTDRLRRRVVVGDKFRPTRELEAGGAADRFTEPHKEIAGRDGEIRII